MAAPLPGAGRVRERGAGHGLRALLPARPGGPVRGAGRSLQRRGVRVAMVGVGHGRHRRGHHRHRDDRGRDRRRAGRGGQLPAVRRRVGARRRHPHPPGAGRRAGGACRAGRAHPCRRGGARRRRGTQPHRPGDARRGRPPREPDGGAGGGRSGRRRTQPGAGGAGVRLDQRDRQAGDGRDAPAARGAASGRQRGTGATAGPRPAVGAGRGRPRRRARPSTSRSRASHARCRRRSTCRPTGCCRRR